MYEEFSNLADAIAAGLLADEAIGTFSQRFPPPSVLWADRDIQLETTNLLRVDVAPVSFDIGMETRGSWVAKCKYDIGVRKRFDFSSQDIRTGKAADDDIRSLVELVSDLLGWFLPVPPDCEGRRFTSIPEAIWVSEPDGSLPYARTPITIDWEHLRTLHQFTGWFPVTYQVSRDV